MLSNTPFIFQRNACWGGRGTSRFSFAFSVHDVKLSRPAAPLSVPLQGFELKVYRLLQCVVRSYRALGHAYFLCIRCRLCVISVVLSNTVLELSHRVPNVALESWSSSGWRPLKTIYFQLLSAVCADSWTITSRRTREQAVRYVL